MSRKNSLEKWADFAFQLQRIREQFPEHAKEIDRAIYDVGQKLDSCGDPNCTCRMTFENFHAIAKQNYAEKQR